MSIEPQSYIQYQDFETFFKTSFPNEKADIIERSLADVFSIVSNGCKSTAYIRLDNKVKTIEGTENIRLNLVTAVTLLFELSFKNLPAEQQHTIKSMFPTQYKKIFLSKNVNHYYKELFLKLRREII
jgi:hypothetical protein